MSRSVRPLVFVALFGALFILMSTITIPIGAVPITLQNLAIMLAGGFLGAFYGFSSIGIVIALTATGIPLIHGQGGLAFILGPTGGFLWMFPICALLSGFFASRILNTSADRPRFVTLAMLFGVFMLFGSLISYITGVPWLAHLLDISTERALVIGMYPFLPFDAIKALIAALVMYAAQSYRPMLRRTP
ncbi:biotin transporter BioY [Paenibacillus daejeonensis]|uniref:biotin transporter BioY n=1 Tax=Paenibacillus daejeonensis TaxID=135193 RepID=UPI0003617614|nr:biotin transporter BioY [Paenibacillus daejeonensis]